MGMAPGGMPPGIMPPRATGGRVRKAGGRVNRADGGGVETIGDATKKYLTDRVRATGRGHPAVTMPEVEPKAKTVPMPTVEPKKMGGKFRDTIGWKRGGAVKNQEDPTYKTLRAEGLERVNKKYGFGIEGRAAGGRVGLTGGAGTGIGRLEKVSARRKDARSESPQDV